MEKAPRPIIIAIIFVLFIVSGCNHQGVNNLPIQSRMDKLVNPDEISDLDEKPQYKVVDQVRFHVLINEYLNNNDKANPDISLLVREYWCFDGTRERRQVYPKIHTIALPKSTKIKSA